MSDLLARIKIPGVVPILVISGLTLYVAWELPEYAMWLPFLLLGVSILANRIAPDNPQVKQLVAMLYALIPFQPAVTRDVRMTSGPDAPQGEQVLRTRTITETDVERVVARSRIDKILWG